MRAEPTDAERMSLAALKQALIEQGHAVETVPRAVEDKPDALLRVGGALVACECIQVPPAYILQHLHKLHPEATWNGKPVLALIWPNEPHQWVAEAVQKKAALCSTYLGSTTATEAWLLVHTPVQANQALLDGSQEWIQWAVRHGAKMARHPFRQIFLWTPQHGIYAAWNRERDEATHSSLGMSFSPGYPTLCVNRFRVPFTTLARDADGAKEESFLLGHAQRVVTAPMDAEYRKHQPATRLMTYEVCVRAWATRAEISTVAVFPDEGTRADFGASAMEGLQPETIYWHHALHEFRAPKLLQTEHVIQPF